jgi:elongation factor 2
MFACVLTAQPKLMEPVFLVEIQCPETAVGGVYSVMTRRRGVVFEENPIMGTPMYQIKAYLPVNESFGFDSALRAGTGGQAFPQCIFDHWEAMNGDPLTEGTKEYEIVKKSRVRKGLSEEPFGLDKYYDKL